MIEEKNIKIGNQYFKLEQKFVLSEYKNIDNDVAEKNYRGDIYEELLDYITSAQDGGQKLNKEDVEKMLKELREKKTKDIICIMNNDIAVFNNYNIDDTDLIIITRNLLSLKILDLSKNHEITEIGIKYLANGLKNSIENLHHDNGERIYDFRRLYSDDKNNKLQKLYLNKSNINDKSAEYLAEALKSSECQLKELSLIGNRITDKGVEYLAKALKSPNCQLKVLDICFNDITDEGLKILAEALKNPNCKLCTLSCLNNYTNYGNDATKALSEALLIKKCDLRELNEYKDEYRKYFSSKGLFLLEKPFNLFNKIIKNIKIINN